MSATDKQSTSADVDGTPDNHSVGEADVEVKAGEKSVEEPVDNVDKVAEEQVTKESNKEVEGELAEPQNNGVDTNKAGGTKEDDEQELEALSTKKRTDSGAADASKRKRRRRQYDDAPKEEPESDKDDEDDDQDGKEDEEGDGDDDEDGDDLLEIDESNIIAGGRRTRGKKIDYQKVDKEAPAEEDEEEEDGDFEVKNE